MEMQSASREASSQILGDLAETYCSAHWIGAVNPRIYSNRPSRDGLQSAVETADLLLCSLDLGRYYRNWQSGPSAVPPPAGWAVQTGAESRGFWPFGQKQRVCTLLDSNRSSPRRHKRLQTVENYRKACLFSRLFLRSPRSSAFLHLWLPSLQLPAGARLATQAAISRGFWPSGQKRSLLAARHLLCTGNRRSRELLQAGFWGNRPPGTAMLIGSGPVIHFVIGAVGGPPVTFWGK